MTKKILYALSFLLFFNNCLAMEEALDQNRPKSIEYSATYWLWEMIYKYWPWSNNFTHDVTNQLFSSGKLTKEEVAYYKKEYNIKTIISLRGKNKDGTPRDKKLEQICNDLKITFYAVNTDCNIRPTKEDFKDLVYACLTSKGKMLVCATGGIGSVRCQYAIAVWLLARLTFYEQFEDPIELKEKALAPLSFWRGYFYFWHPTPSHFMNDVSNEWVEQTQKILKNNDPLDISKIINNLSPKIFLEKRE
jgi:hypothetical protein